MYGNKFGPAVRAWKIGELKSILNDKSEGHFLDNLS